jgi:hypothetical protein
MFLGPEEVLKNMDTMLFIRLCFVGMKEESLSMLCGYEGRIFVHALWV